MSRATEIITSAYSRLRKIQAHFGRLADDSSFDPLLLIPDVAPKEFLYSYLHQSVEGLPERKRAWKMEMQRNESIMDYCRGAETYAVETQITTNLRTVSTLEVVQAEKMDRSSCEACPIEDLLSHVSVGKGAEASSQLSEFSGTTEGK